ncbi:unnamed protein product [Orchesella dallaii]|uniref:RRM domain-containing protein n=1 Tax=Orchesella dallaii TaxID=48710 RepID=A0ABP1RHU1_9HEXA
MYFCVAIEGQETNCASSLTISERSPLCGEKVAPLKETEGNGCSPVTSSLQATVAPTTTAGAIANNVVIVSTTDSTSDSVDEAPISLNTEREEGAPSSTLSEEKEVQAEIENSPEVPLDPNPSEKEEEERELISSSIVQTEEDKIEVPLALPTSSSSTILAVSSVPTNGDSTGSPPPAKKRALVASSSAGAVVPSFYTPASIHPAAALILPAGAQPSVSVANIAVGGGSGGSEDTFGAMISAAQQHSAAVQSIQTATPISSTGSAGGIANSVSAVAASSANPVSSLSYVNHAGGEVSGAGEVMPSLASAATQLITPTLMGQQKDTTWTKLFVGGLPYHTTDKSLRDHFKVYGEIEEAVVITDRQTGKSRGYGFVIMADRASAERACKEPNPIIDGRKANVNLAILGAKPRGNVAALTAVNNAVAAANAAAALAAASGAFPFNTATSAIHRAAAAAAAAAAATGGSVYPSVATTTNPSTAAALLAASQYGLSPTASALNQQQSGNQGMVANTGSPAGYLYHAAAAAHQPQSAAQQAATAALLQSHQYGGSPLLSFQHHPHQGATISATSPAFAAALAAQQANQHVQFYDTTGQGYHQTAVSVAGSSGVSAGANPSNSTAGLTSAPNVVGHGSTVVSTGAHHYSQGTPTMAGHHHLSAAAQQAFAALAHLDPYSSYLAAAAAASGQGGQSSAAANQAYAYMPGSAAATAAAVHAAANASSAGTAHHHHSHHPNAVNPYAAAAAP